MSRDAVVVAAFRTPFARLDGGLAHLDAAGLAAALLPALARRGGVPPDDLDDVLLGFAAAGGGNPARRAVLAAGLPPGLSAVSLDRQCSAGLDAITVACHLVRSGAGRAYLAGGADSASRSPLRAREGVDHGVTGRAFFPREEFAAGEWDDPGMAESAESVAREFGITRSRQDAYAARSHARAVAAEKDGLFTAMRVAVGDAERDECPRPRLDEDRCARFPPLVVRGGTVTAANSSRLADGAAGVAVFRREAARAAGHREGLVFVDAAAAGVDPRLCGLGAIDAVQALRRRDPGFDPRAVREFAITEAFASQVIATVDALGLDEDRVNTLGGAIALGHPWGASGAAQVVHLAHRLREAGPGAEGVAAAAVAGGMGVASRWRWETL